MPKSHRRSRVRRTRATPFTERLRRSGRRATTARTERGGEAASELRTGEARGRSERDGSGSRRRSRLVMTRDAKRLLNHEECFFRHFLPRAGEVLVSEANESREQLAATEPARRAKSGTAWDRIRTGWRRSRSLRSRAATPRVRTGPQSRGSRELRSLVITRGASRLLNDVATLRFARSMRGTGFEPADPYGTAS